MLYLYDGNKTWAEFNLLNRGQSLIPLKTYINDEEWVEKEFEDLPLGDKRRNVILTDLLRLKVKIPNSSFLESIEGNSAMAQRVYRQLSNLDKKCTDNPQFLEIILNGYNNQYIGRIRYQRVVCHGSDGMRLNFSNKIKCTNMGQIASNSPNSSTLGLHGHYTESLNFKGDNIGICRCDFKSYPKRQKGEKVAPEEKKSFLWKNHADSVII